MYDDCEIFIYWIAKKILLSVILNTIYECLDIYDECSINDIKECGYT